MGYHAQATRTGGATRRGCCCSCTRPCRRHPHASRPCVSSKTTTTPSMSSYRTMRVKAIPFAFSAAFQQGVTVSVNASRALCGASHMYTLSRQGDIQVSATLSLRLIGIPRSTHRQIAASSGGHAETTKSAHSMAAACKALATVVLLGMAIDVRS